MSNNVIVSLDEKKQMLLEVIKEYKIVPGALMIVLQKAQLIFGYIPLEVQKIVSEGLDIPVAEVYGVVTFYSFFTLEPKGEFVISVCMGTACYVKGSNLILEKIEKILGVKAGECTPDRKFSIDACRCIGACGLAPVITINEDVYGRLEVEEISGILAKYKEA